MKIDLGLSDEKMHDIVHAAILAEIGPEQRDRILAQALTFLTQQPEKPRYTGDPRKSPLEEAFQRAVERVTVEVVQQMVLEDASVIAKIKSLVGEAVVRLLSQPFENSAEALRIAFAEALVKRD